MGFFKFRNKDYDKIVTEAINGIDFEPIAEDGEFKLYCGSDITGGYRFLNCNVIGPFETRSKKGCLVIFSNGQEEIEVESETTEISSDFSDTLGVGVTAFVIEIEGRLQNWMENDQIQTIRIVFPKRTIAYSTVYHTTVRQLLKDNEIDDSEE